MSDFWERQYNGYNLFPATFDPQADEDGDGCSNLDESIFGTDPLDGTPPAGYLQAEVTHVPATYITGANGPELLTPEAFVVAWPTLVGKQYTLLFSPDLTPGSWLPVDESMAGTGSEIQIAVTPTQEGGGIPIRLFWRIAVKDIDTDGDGFTDYEEAQKGSDPLVADRDGDGLPDAWEIANGLDPDDDGTTNANNGAAGDADGDGFSNSREQQAGTKANDASDFPEELAHISNRVHGGTHFTVSPDSHAGTITYIPWDQSAKAEKSLTSELTTATMDQELGDLNTDKLPLTLTPAAAVAASPLNIAGTNLADPGCQTSARASMTHNTDQSGGATTGGQYSTTRCWVHAPSKPVARDYHLFRYTSHTKTKQGEPTTTQISDAAIVTLTIPANTIYSNTLDLTTTSSYETNAQHITTVNLRHISIIPDDNMAGVIGDMVVSNKGIDGEKHFVTPKEAGQFVNLKAAGIEAEQFDQLFEWECDANKGAQGTASNKYKVKRNDAGQIALKIKAKAGGTVVARINVWVVWSSVSVTPYEKVKLLADPSKSFFAGLTGKDHAWRFVFTILPVELFSSTVDHPNLSGKPKTKVPGADKPYFADTTLEGDTAILKWDLSRQVENRIFNRELIPKSQFPNTQVFANQPTAEESVAAYPQISSEGNDDPIFPDLGVDENANPYESFVGQGLAHGVGQISSCDGPIFSTPTAPVAAGASFVNLANFREFARLEIASETPAAGATTWYRISDHKEWHHVLSAIYGLGTTSEYHWGDVGSSSKEGVFSIPEEE